MPTIELVNHRLAQVDEEDFAFVQQWSWRAQRAGHGEWYAVCRERPGVLMHRDILGSDVSSGLFVDHVNGDGLDNRRSNLRPCTNAQNMMNQRKRAGCSSMFKGVCLDTGKGLWVASIHMDGIKRNLGFFQSEHDAARAYDQAAEKLFGEFALTNADQGLYRHPDRVRTAVRRRRMPKGFRAVSLDEVRRKLHERRSVT